MTEARRVIHQSAFLDGNHLVGIEHVTVKDVERYGRFVSRVSVGGEDLSLALVAAGWRGTTSGIPMMWRSRPRMGRSAAGTISFDTQVDTLAAAHCGTHTIVLNRFAKSFEALSLPARFIVLS